jgi:protein phosphatase
VTEDHSRRLELIKAGLLDGDGPAPVHDGVLTHAIGLDEVLPVDLYQYTWEPGDRLVLCSDGLSRLSPATIAAIALRYPPPVAARELIEQANRQDGSDNSTAVILAWEGTLKRDTARTGQGWRRGIGCGLALGLLAGLLLGWFVASYLL